MAEIYDIASREQRNNVDGGGGLSLGSNIQRRVAPLETHVRAIRETLSDIRIQLASMFRKSDLDAFLTEVNQMRVDVKVM